MTFYREYCKIAERFPEKLAILSKGANYQYKTILQFLPVFEEQILSVTKGKGRRIAFRSPNYEIFVLMILMASKHGYELIFQRNEPSPEIEGTVDWFISEVPTAFPKSSKFILIDVKKLTQQPVSARDMEVVPDTEAEFIYGTSGSTGTPKYFPVKDSYILNGIQSSLDAYGIPDHRRRVYCGAAYSMRWFNTVAARVLLSGGSILALGAEVNRLKHYIDLWGVNTLCMAPMLMNRLLNTENAKQFLGGIDTVVLGGATVDMDLMRRTYEATNANVSVGYGATETTGVCDFIYDPNETYEPGFVGYHRDENVELGFFDEDRNLLPDAKTGILGIKSKKYIDPRKYLGQSGSEQGSFEKDYFITGDYFEKRGDKLFLIGRDKQIINVSGNKYSLEVVEAFLSKKLSDQQVAVKVTTDASGKEMLICYIVAEQEPDRDTLNTDLRTNFSGVQVAKFVKIDALPMTDSGKLNRKALK